MKRHHGATMRTNGEVPRSDEAPSRPDERQRSSSSYAGQNVHVRSHVDKTWFPTSDRNVCRTSTYRKPSEITPEVNATTLMRTMRLRRILDYTTTHRISLINSRPQRVPSNLDERLLLTLAHLDGLYPIS